MTTQCHVDPELSSEARGKLKFKKLLLGQLEKYTFLLDNAIKLV